MVLLVKKACHFRKLTNRKGEVIRIHISTVVGILYYAYHVVFRTVCQVE